MPVVQCAACPRLVSISRVPGGNPVARADPAKWSVLHTRCVDCGACLCDRCAPASARHCQACGAALPTEDGGPLSTRGQARIAALQAGRRWSLLALFVQAAFPLVLMSGGDPSIDRIVYWTGIGLGVFSAWHLLTALRKDLGLRTAGVVAQFLPLASLLVLLLLRGRALRALAELPAVPAGEEEFALGYLAPRRG